MNEQYRVIILAFKKGPIIGVLSGCQHDKYEKKVHR